MLWETSQSRQEAPVPGLVDSTLEEIDSSLRDLRRQLATLEACRRQIVGDDETQISRADRAKGLARSKVTRRMGRRTW